MTVYFAIEHSTGRVKIGYCESNNPQRDRIAPALTMNSSEVQVIAMVPGASVDVEKQLHEAFHYSRVARKRGGLTEFFEPSPALWSLIGWVQRHKSLPCPPAGCASLVWDPR